MRTSRCSSAATASTPTSRTASAADKDTGLAKFPFRESALDEVWLEIVMLAHNLIVWIQALMLDGDLANTKPKRLRYRLLHGRRAKLRLHHRWPWAPDLLAAFKQLKTLTATTA